MKTNNTYIVTFKTIPSDGCLFEVAIKAKDESQLMVKLKRKLKDYQFTVVKTEKIA